MRYFLHTTLHERTSFSNVVERQKEILFVSRKLINKEMSIKHFLLRNFKYILGAIQIIPDTLGGGGGGQQSVTRTFFAFGFLNSDLKTFRSKKSSLG